MQFMSGRIIPIEQYVVDMVSVSSKNIVKIMSAEKTLLYAFSTMAIDGGSQVCVLENEERYCFIVS
ncbi:hypothetical protein CEQ48_03755 [Vibrio tarriae]|uniref:Uncharacterized protein n=1 Tax=Vibrio tarriae TaxID=2014742 RepID=A0AAU8WB97_9VIBR|nr:hypothetical protein CEQ48_03755 [Vibrio tarriae]